MKIGKVTYWNSVRGYGFLTVSQVENNAITQAQYFFHNSHFTKHQVPVLDAYCVFRDGDPLTSNKKTQAVNVRFATAEEIANHVAERSAGLSALAGGAR